ncbi:DUF6444 domain-containing protein [Streptomyces solisilvae]|uniref:DUF6444 domain-containing protein n=1 Tax=Streptomyces malaysiensis TaxID=92644 RepID=UPI0036C1D7A4
MELERQVTADSRNSSRPPPNDGLRKQPALKSLRKPGAAKGDPGGWLEQVADPDQVVDPRPAACDGCGAGLGSGQSRGYRARRMFDLLAIRPVVTEHWLH